MHWFNVSVGADRSELDRLETLLWDQGAVSVTVEDAQDRPIYEPPPGEHPIWDRVVVTGLFESEIDTTQIKRQIEKAKFELIEVEQIDDRPWEREWLSRFHPMCFGKRLWVCPTTEELDDDGKVIIRLDPGLAFGTGTHETTRLCLEYLDSLKLSGWHVIDYGCGSGILGIAAALLGAESVVGVDTDPQALVATQNNAALNQVTIATQMPGKPLPVADLVIANILAQPLVELADMLIDTCKPGGSIVLAGIMSSQSEWVEAAYAPRTELIDHQTLNGWDRLLWRR